MKDQILVPPNWELNSLKDVASDLHQGINTAADKINYVLNGYKILQSKHITTGVIEWDDARNISKKDYLFYQERYNPRKHDILLTNIGTIGKSLIVKDELQFLIAWNIFLIRLKNKSSSDYVNYYLKYLDGKKYFFGIATGVATMFVNKLNLSNIKIPFPTVKTQKAIVSKIEELFSELDKGVENLLTAQQQLKTYRQSVLKWAFEGRLTNENVLEGVLPKGWKWETMKHLLSDPQKGMSTGPFGTMLKKSEHQKKGVPVLGIENIGEGVFQMPNKIFITDEKAAELKNFRVKESDIIISRSGTVGEICLLPKNMENSIISTNLIRVTLNLELVNPKYFVYLFQGGKVRQQVFDLCKGSSRAFLNQTILNSLSFPCCSTGEQHNIVQAIESRFSVADKMQESITQSLQQAAALRQSILKKAFEGKLVIE